MATDAVTVYNSQVLLSTSLGLGLGLLTGVTVYLSRVRVRLLTGVTVYLSRVRVRVTHRCYCLPPIRVRVRVLLSTSRVWCEAAVRDVLYV